MATYIQGVTDYIPQIQPWTPDYNFYQGALEKKQNMYDAGWQRMNTLYNSMLNTPMTRDDNNAKRDQYFKNIQNDINRLSGVDLSIQQNVDAASQIFNPIIKDKYILNDMSWTKRYQQEMEKAENFRNCTDPEKCGGKYWEEGVKALNYMREDFRSVSPDDSLYSSAPRYVPYTNAIDKAFEKLKDYGFEQKNIRWSPDGRYVIKETNGVQTVEPMTSFLLGTIGQDPEVMDVYKTKAYVARKDWMYSNQESYPDPVTAEQTYYNQLLAPAVTSLEENAQEANIHTKDKTSELTAYERYIRDMGIVPNSQEHKEYATLKQEADKATAYEQYINGVLDNAANIPNNTNASAMRMNSDAVVAYALMQNDLLQAANAYQQLTYEVDIDEDQYALTAFKEQLAYEYNIAEAEAKSIIELQEYLTKARIDILKEGGGLGLGSFGPAGPAAQNIHTTEDDLDAHDPASAEKLSVRQEAVKMENKLKAELMNPKAAALAEAFQYLTTLDYSSSENQEAQWDLAQIYLNNMKKKTADGKFVSFSPGQALFGDLFKDAKGLSSQAMVNKILESSSFLTSADIINNLSYDQIDSMYNTMLKYLDPNRESPYNKKKSYLKNLWEGENSTMYHNKAYAAAGDDVEKVRENLIAQDTDLLRPEFLRSAKQGEEAVLGKFNLTEIIENRGQNVHKEENQFKNIGGLADVLLDAFSPKNNIYKHYDEESFINRSLEAIIPWKKKGKDNPLEKLHKQNADFGKLNADDFLGDYLNPISGLSKTQGVRYFEDPANFNAALTGYTYPDVEVPYHLPYDGYDSFVELNHNGNYSKDTFYEYLGAVENQVKNRLSKIYNGESKEQPEDKAQRIYEKGLDKNLIEKGWEVGKSVFGFSSEPSTEDVEKELGDNGLTDFHFHFINNADNVVDGFIPMDSYLGGGFGGVGGLAQTDYNIDPANYGSSYMKFGKSLFIDLMNNTKDIEVIKRGAEEKLSKSTANTLVKDYYNHIFENQWKLTDKDRPRFSVKYLGQYKGDPETAKVTIIFDRDWIEDNDGSKENPGLTRKGESTMYWLAEEGLSFTLPTANLENYYKKSAGADYMDLFVKSTGMFDFTKDYPLAGDIKLYYDPKTMTYSVKGYSNSITPEGKIVKEPIPDAWNANFQNVNMTFSQIHKMWKPAIENLHKQIEENQQSAKEGIAIYDPVTLQQYPLENQ